MSEKTILLIEDNPDDEELALLAFQQSRIANKVVVCRDGQEALDYIFDSDEKTQKTLNLPQLILLDLKLPKVSGLEVLRRIRGDERTALLPVVMLTSSREEEDIVKSYKLGASSYIRKPVDFARFVEAIQQVQMYWLVLNESPLGAN